MYTFVCLLVHFYLVPRGYPYVQLVGLIGHRRRRTVTLQITNRHPDNLFAAQKYLVAGVQ